MTAVEELDLGELQISEFDAFWSVFRPRRDRARAEGAFRRARRVARFEDIMRAAEAYANEKAGTAASELRSAVDWLRAEQWKSEKAPITPRPAPRRRRRADTSKPRRIRSTTRVRQPERETADQMKRRWCHERGITVAEYEQRKHDLEWIERMKTAGSNG